MAAMQSFLYMKSKFLPLPSLLPYPEAPGIGPKVSKLGVTHTRPGLYHLVCFQSCFSLLRLIMSYKYLHEMCTFSQAYCYVFCVCMFPNGDTLKWYISSCTLKETVLIFVIFFCVLTPFFTIVLILLLSTDFFLFFKCR